MTDALEDHEGTVSIGGRTITSLRFAYDIDGLAGEENLAKLVERLEQSLNSLRHGYQYREDQVVDKQRQWHQPVSYTHLTLPTKVRV